MIYAILIPVVLLFAFVDVWYIARFMAIALKSKFNRRDTKKNPLTIGELTGEFISKGIVLPSDLDAFLHMNNSKYFKEFDLARIQMAADLQFLNVLAKHRGVFLVGEGNIRYLRPMKLFQTYQIKTRIVSWTEKAFYVEQEMVTSRGTVAAVMTCKIALKRITTDVFLSECCGNVLSSPKLTDEIGPLRTSSSPAITRSKSVTAEGSVDAGIRKRRRSITSLDR